MRDWEPHQLKGRSLPPRASWRVDPSNQPLIWLRPPSDPLSQERLQIHPRGPTIPFLQLSKELQSRIGRRRTSKLLHQVRRKRSFSCFVVPVVGFGPTYMTRERRRFVPPRHIRQTQTEFTAVGVVLRQYGLEFADALSFNTVHHPSSTVKSSYFEDYNKPTTPGRKRSAPIAIELPGRNPQTVYTPLSARGDLPGYV